jgi:hypothetical protein
MVPFHIPNGRLLVMGWKHHGLYLCRTYIDLLVSKRPRNIVKEVGVLKVIEIWLNYTSGVKQAIAPKGIIRMHPS